MVHERTYSRVECYEEALRSDPCECEAWRRLGDCGGGVVRDMQVAVLADCVTSSGRA